MREDNIVHAALDNLAAHTGIKGKWKNIPKDSSYDGTLVLSIDGHEVSMYAEVKEEIRAYQVLSFILRTNQDKPLIIVANRIFPKIKEQLRSGKIAYLEANGNFFLNQEGHYIWLEGQKDLVILKTTGNRAFTKTGAKVIFYFLLDENYVKAHYRFIAELAQVALGNIGWVISGLEELGFLIKLDKHQWKLQNRKDLLQKWIEAYEEKLKPSLEIGTFRFLKEEEFNNWKNLQLNSNKSWWGGEPAGDILTNYLRPEILTLYTEETRMDLIKNYRLIPDINGNVKAYKKFWQIDIQEKTVHPMLVYADLINTNDKRCTETAQKIYNEYLQDKF